MAKSERILIVDDEVKNVKLLEALAGHEFNINSPVQLGKVLFEELGIASAGKTGKGKQLSTAAESYRDLIVGLRVAEEVEREGLDINEHGEKAYHL